MMLQSKYQLIVLVLVHLAIPTRQESGRYNWSNPNWDRSYAIPMEALEGKFIMTTDRQEQLLKDVAEYLDTKPEDIEAIQNHTTVGNYELKVLDRSYRTIQITMETLAGKIKSILNPGDTGEFPWFDGRMFFVKEVSQYINHMGNAWVSLISLRNLGSRGIGMQPWLGKDVAEWLYNIPRQHKRISIRYKRAE